MDVSKSSPSPYAAPNTPIASSKRPRVNTKDMKSPSKPIQSPSIDTSKKNGYSHSTNTHVSQGIAPPPTPSKIMFSPGLRNGESSSHSRSVYADSHMEANDENFDVNEYGYIVQEEYEVQDSAMEDEKEAEVEEEEDVFNPYLFIAGLPAHSTVSIKDKICLPPAHGERLTLALDLDETLVHCTVDPIEKPDLVFPVSFNGSLYQVYVRKRPYLDYFLETVTKSFEVVVFTASQKVYAD
eukprot:gene39454-53344_t